MSLRAILPQKEAKQSISQVLRLLRRPDTIGPTRNDSYHYIAVRRYMAIHVDKEKCAGCGSCVPACPFGLIELIDDKANIKEEGCTLCGACVSACPTGAVKLTETARAGFRVLIVDDELVMRDSLKEWLLDEGYGNMSQKQMFYSSHEWTTGKHRPSRKY